MQFMQHCRAVSRVSASVVVVAVLVVALAFAVPGKAGAQAAAAGGGESKRERLLMDFGWRFAFGHATDPARDFDPAPSGTAFSYFAKAGTAAGAASAGFDDR